eukprot:gene21024-biopygen7094
MRRGWWGAGKALSSLAPLARRVMDPAAPRDAPPCRGTRHGTRLGTRPGRATGRASGRATGRASRLHSSDRYPGASGRCQKGPAVAVTDIQGVPGDVRRAPP